MFLIRSLLFVLAVLSVAISPAQAGPWTIADRAAVRAVLGADTANRSDPELESAVIDYADTELGQRVRPQEIDRLWAIAPGRRDVTAELAAARAEGRLGAWLQSLSPGDPTYRGLQAAAIRYRRLVADGGWGRLPDGDLVVGATMPAVVALRARLSLEGYATQAAQPQRFDAALSAKLALYQADRSLPPTGRLDRATRAALDVAAAARLATIEANLERRRWLPRTRPETRFDLDIAAAEGRLIVDGVSSLEMRVVVGDLKHKTPMFVPPSRE